MRVIFVGLALTLSGWLSTATLGTSSAQPAVATVPSQGSYMVGELSRYAGQYWARVAGRDTNLPPKTNGHDEFAAQWTRDMLASLHGLHAGVIQQSFPTPGFRGLPATRPGMNVVISVPGSHHPDRAVVIGTHYDGEPFSKGSANDDASGCMIILGLARDLGAMWRAHGPPSLTVEFALFDAEEQGLIGSAFYTFAQAHGAAMPRPVVMLNEEQSGVGYPVHPFGLRSQDPLPMYAGTVGRLPRYMGTPAPMDTAAINLLLDRTKKVAGTAFSQLHATYSPLPYRGGNAPVFRSSDAHYLEIGANNECCSDNDPFQFHGIPNLTLSGNYDYFEATSKPWSYPFDQPWDTPANLACDTGGSPQPSRALMAALDLPMTLSALLVGDYAPSAQGRGLAIFSTVAQAGKPVHFTEVGATSARWSFGDGTTASGGAVAHTYRKAGKYHVQVRSGKMGASSVVSVAVHQETFNSSLGVLSPPPVRPWTPVELRDIPGCH